MKLLLQLIITLMIVSSIAVPINNPSDEVENIDSSYPETNVESVSVGPDYISFLAPIPISPYSFFDGVEEYFRNIRQRLLNRFIDVADTFDLDQSKGNSTSTTKIIDGHRVEINNTVYFDKNENGDEVIKVRVLHIRPLDENEASTIVPDIKVKAGYDDEKTVKPLAEGTTAQPDSVNEVDSPKTASHDEISASTASIIELIEQNILNKPVQNSYKFLNENFPLYYATKTGNDNLNHAEEIDLYELKNDSQTLTQSTEITNEQKKQAPQKKTIHISGKIDKIQNYDVNMQDKIQSINTTKEVSETGAEQQQNQVKDEIQKNYRSRENFESSSEEDANDDVYEQYNNFEQLNREWGILQENDTNDNNINNNDNKDYDDNEIDIYESIPVDLSNDINVNYIAQQNGATQDPDIEMFEKEINLNDYTDVNNLLKNDLLASNVSFNETLVNVNDDDDNDDEDDDDSYDRIDANRKTLIK